MTDYIGDGVYITIEGWGQIKLFTYDGVGVQDVIYLEPEVYRALVAYVAEKTHGTEADRG